MSNGKYKSGFHPLRGLFGYRVVSLDRKDLEGLLNLLGKRGVSYGELKVEGDQAILRLPFFGFSALSREAEAEGILLVSVAEFGLPALASRHKLRLGLPLGFALGLALVFMSQMFIWDVRVDGARRLSEDDVFQVLTECGLSVGEPKSKLDIDVIENRVLIVSDEISWISVNILGTVAKVEIRELDFAPKADEAPVVANLVAEEGGTIVALEDIKGQISVEVGQSVGRGQLLVGGIVGNELRGFRYLCASGKVLAQVESRLTAHIPLKYQKKRYTGEEKCEKYLIFFKNEIKFFGNSGNLYPVYDKIETVEYLRAPNGEKLPFGVRTVRYAEYEYEEKTRDDTELRALADYKMNLLIYALDGEVTEKRLIYSKNEKGAQLDCVLTVIKNIARTQEIEIN